MRRLILQEIAAPTLVHRLSHENGRDSNITVRRTLRAYTWPGRPDVCRCPSTHLSLTPHQQRVIGQLQDAVIALGPYQ